MVKRAKITYKSEETLLGVYYYILKHIQQLNTVFVDLEKVNYIISNTKSYFYKLKIVIIEYLCNNNGQLLKALKYNIYMTKTGTKGKKKYIKEYSEYQKCLSS